MGGDVKEGRGRGRGGRGRGKCCHQMSYVKVKCTKFDFGWGSAPDSLGGAHSAPPDS